MGLNILLQKRCSSKINEGWEFNELVEVMQTLDNKDIPILDNNDKKK